MIYGGGDRNQISKSFLMIFLYFSYTSPLFGQPQDVYDSGWLVLVVKQKKNYILKMIYIHFLSLAQPHLPLTLTPHISFQGVYPFYETHICDRQR